jgi:putative glycosyltransferase (TIGR04372 family)
LNEKAAGQHRGQYLDLFYFIESTNHVNRQWKKMWKRVLPVFPWSKLAQFVERINNWFSGHEVHKIKKFMGWLNVMPTIEEHVSYLEGRNPKVYSKYNQRIECILGSIQSNLSFTEAEEVRGEKEIQQLGIPLDNPFICFHSRDSAFLDDALDNFDWKYHNFRDSSIQNYLNAAEEMTRRGCYAVRLGAKVNDKVKSINPKVIDYASNGMRTDFLDIYLSAKCRFIICSDTGMSHPAEVFKRPLAFVNWPIPLRVPVYIHHGLVIFKKFYLKNEKRFMTFSESINLKFGGRDTNEILASLNLELIENTPEEIRAVTIEMDERLNGTWQTTPDDEELQKRFWALFGPDKLKSPDLWIGAEYLRDNQELLK